MLRISQCLMRSAGTYVPKKPTYFPEDGKLTVFSNNAGGIWKYWFFGGLFSSIGSLSYYQLIYPSAAALSLFTATIATTAIIWVAPSLVVEELALLPDGKTIELTTCGVFKYKTFTLPIAGLKGTKDNQYYYLRPKKWIYCIGRNGIIHEEELLGAIFKGLEIDNSRFIKVV